MLSWKIKDEPVSRKSGFPHVFFSFLLYFLANSRLDIDAHRVYFFSCASKTHMRGNPRRHLWPYVDGLSLLSEVLLAFYVNQGIQPLSLLYSLNCKLFPSVQFSSVAQSCPTLCNPMNRSTPSLPVHHQLPVHSDSRPSSQ